MKRTKMLKKLALCATTLFAALGWAAAPTQTQVTTVAQTLVDRSLQAILPERTVKTVEWVAFEDGFGVWAVQLAPSGHLILANSTKYRPLISFSENDFVSPEADTPQHAALLAAAQRVAAAEAADGEENAAWYPTGASLLATTATPDSGSITAQPIDTALWYQYNALSWYAPGSAPCGCVATAQAQAMHGLQWPVYPERFFETELNYTDLSSNKTTETYRFTPYSKFDYSKMSDTYADLVENTANNHQVARLALMNDIISKMVFRHNVSTTTVPPATITPWSYYLDKRTRTKITTAFTAEDKTAIKNAMEAGFPVACHTASHAVLASGYATIKDDNGNEIPYVRINYGYALQADNNGRKTAWYHIDDNDVLTFSITNPTKAVQCDPLPAISSASPTISWHIPKCYAGAYTTDVTSFSVKAIPVTAKADDWSASDFTAGAIAGNTKLLTVSKDTLTVNMGNYTDYNYPFIYYTLDPIFIPTADSKWRTTYTAEYPISGAKVSLQVLPLGGAWESVGTIATAHTDPATTAEFSLENYAGKPCKLRYFINSLNVNCKTFKATAISVTATQVADKNSTATKSASISPDDKEIVTTFSCQFSDLTAGEDYVFAVTPLFDKDEGTTGYCYTTVTDDADAVENFATFKVTSPSTEATAKNYMQIEDNFFRYCTYNGTSYIRVDAGAKVTELKTYSSHPTAFPDDAFTVTSYNNGIFDIKVDNTKIPESPRVNDRVNLSLVATTAAGTISSHELSLAFTTDEKFAVAESEPAAPEVNPGDDPVEPETPSATTTPVPGAWTKLALPGVVDPNASGDFIANMNAGSPGTDQGAVNVLNNNLSVVEHGNVVSGSNGANYCSGEGTGEGSEGYWSGSSISLFGRTEAGGMSALIVPVSGQIPHGTVIEKLRVKATIRGTYNDGGATKNTIGGNCSVAIGHATYDAQDKKAYTYTATASAADSGGNGTNTQIEAILTFANAITWNESGDNPDMIVLAVSTPKSTASPYIVEINSVEYFTELTLPYPVLLLNFCTPDKGTPVGEPWIAFANGTGNGTGNVDNSYSEDGTSTAGVSYNLYMNKGKLWSSTLSDTILGTTFANPDGSQTYSSIWDECAATLGLDSIPESCLTTSGHNGASGTQTITISNLDPNAYYTLYLVGGGSGKKFNARVTEYDSTKIPVISFATSSTKAYATITNLDQSQSGTDLCVMRVHNFAPTQSGTLTIMFGDGANYAASFIALAETEYVPTTWDTVITEKVDGLKDEDKAKVEEALAAIAEALGKAGDSVAVSDYIARAYGTDGKVTATDLIDGKANIAVSVAYDLPLMKELPEVTVAATADEALTFTFALKDIKIATSAEKAKTLVKYCATLTDEYVAYGEEGAAVEVSIVKDEGTLKVKFIETATQGFIKIDSSAE